MSKEMTRIAEREAHWVKWPNGDAGDAIDYALNHAIEVRFFLEDWRGDDLADYEEYHRWLKVQRDGTRAALRSRSEKGGTING